LFGSNRVGLTGTGIEAPGAAWPSRVQPWNP
jgi:hypothetical protein